LLLVIRWAEQKICLGQVDDNVQNMINALDKYTKSVLKKDEEKLLSEVNDVLKLVEIDSGIPDLYKTISQEYN
jgi:Mor family transcriptional regulator